MPEQIILRKRTRRNSLSFFVFLGRKFMQEFQMIDNYLLIRLPEEIDHHNAQVISRQADHLLLDEQVAHLVFDFEGTRFMDSSGIGVLAGRYRKISRFGGKVFVVHADSRIRRIIEMSGLKEIVEIMEEEQDDK